MKLLVKLPSRSRPFQLLRVCQQWQAMAEKPFTLLLTLDKDDPITLGQRTALGKLPNTLLQWGLSDTKIHAVNRSAEDYAWDVLVLASDDMVPVVQGWDTIIRLQFVNGTDHCLWCSDGRQSRLCTIPVMGRRAFEQDAHIYWPEYGSYYADDEWTEKWTRRGKLHKVDGPMFRHDHWIFGANKFDALYRRNKATKAKDHATYLRRLAAGYP